MLRCDIDTRLGQIAILHPASVPVMQALGMDLALENDRPLEEACAMRDLIPEKVLARIAQAERREQGEGADDAWEVLRSTLPRSGTFFVGGLPVND